MHIKEQLNGSHFSNRSMKYFQKHYPPYLHYMKCFKKRSTILGLHEVFQKNNPLYLDYMKYFQNKLSTMLRSLLRVKAIVEAIEFNNLFVKLRLLELFLVLLITFMKRKILSLNTNLKEHSRSYKLPKHSAAMGYALSPCFTRISCVVANGTGVTGHVFHFIINGAQYTFFWEGSYIFGKLEW